MKNGICFILYFVLILEINSNFLRFLAPGSETNTFNYSTINSNITNKNIIDAEYIATKSDQSVAYITNPNIIINNSNLIKTGASSDLDNSEFYGVNSAILVNGGNAKIDLTNITTSSEGSNGITCTNNGSTQLFRTLINSTSNFSRGLLSTFGGSIIGTNVTISTIGRSSACLANDKGEGNILCTYCSLSTHGVGSPLIYSTGNIKVNSINGNSFNSQIAVIEGKNSISFAGDSYATASGNGGMNDSCGILIYQSQPGDPNVDRSAFSCEKANFLIRPDSSVYSTAPFFFVTNTKTSITLNGCAFTYGSGVFLNASQNSHWGTLGENGADVILNLIDQNIEGDFVVDSNSELTINMKNSTIKGKINNNRAASVLKIVLDSNSFINLTGNSYYSSMSNENKNGSNINNGSYSLSYYNDSIIPIRDNSLILNNNLFKIFILSFLMLLL
jgi:hypothetical protein